MQTILQTKLHKPTPGAQTILRERLCSQFDAGLRCRLTLVSAPPGYGKTTAVAQWLEAQADVASVWLSLDPADNEPVRFFTHLLAGLQTLIPQTAAPLLELLRSTQIPEINVIVTSLVNGLAAQEYPIIIVLDDYHTIEQRTIHVAVQHLLDYAPTTLHMVIIARADPPLALARLRSKNQLIEVRMKDLRFQQSETVHFFDRDGRHTLNISQVVQITDRTEGWVAALQLVALSLQGQNNVDAFVERLSGAQRHIVDYLVDEVLTQLPEETKQFLLQTAVLQRLCAPLCEALTGREDSQQILEHLERTNLFLVPLDDERRWYRYHHLFAQFLLNRLGADAARQQHLRAANWFADQGLIIEALHHAYTGHDPEIAGNLLAMSFRTALADGLFTSLIEWYRMLPPHLFEAHPDWQINFAVALFAAGHIPELEVHIEQAEANLGRLAEAECRAAQGWLAALRSLLAAWHLQADDALALAATALELLPDDDALYHAMIHYASGTMLFRVQDRPVDALQAFEQAIHYAVQARHYVLLADAAQQIGLIHSVLGNLYEAEALFRRVLSQIGDVRTLSVLLTAIYDGLALVLLDQWRLDEALAVYPPGFREDIDSSGMPAMQAGCYLTQAQLLAAAGQVGPALELNERTRTLTQQLGDPLMIRLAQTQYARLSLLAGETDLAWQWQARFEAEVSYEERISQAERYFETIFWLQLLLRRGEYQTILTALVPMLEYAVRAGRQAQRVELLVLEALASYGAGRIQQALNRLEAALQLAYRQRNVRYFIEYGAPVQRLLHDYLQSDDIDADVRAFVGRVLSDPAVAMPPGAARGIVTAIEPLTKREAEILHLINLGLTNQEIADRLVISLGTVKKHISNVFLKLNAQNRTQALSRAREYDLLK